HILTNYHGVASAIDGDFEPANVRARSDYRRLRDGLIVNAGVAFGLADQWIVHHEKFSEADTRAYDPARLPAENELDYAVLRTREAIGLQPPSGPGKTPRGWLVPPAQAFEFPADSFLMVIQHPCGDPIAFDDA